MISSGVPLISPVMGQKGDVYDFMLLFDYHPTLVFPNRVMWVSVLVSDCHPELEKPKLDDKMFSISCQ